jgi:uncharacterized protein (TIGR02001 family)
MATLRSVGARCVGVAMCACVLACAMPAWAQVSGSVGVVSDYRYRGYSLSDDKPALQGDIEWAASDGFYAGLFASTARVYYGPDSGLWIPYAGFAKRDSHGRSWDVGIRWSHFDSASEYDYPEVHVGVAFRHVTIRAHYADDYFGGAPGVYVEVDGGVPFADRWQLLLHAGAAHDVENGDAGTRFDARVGVSLSTRACDLSLSWQGTRGETGYPYYPPWDPDDRGGWVLGCVHHW